MAKIVLGIGVSHGTMMGNPPDSWLSAERMAHDRSREHFFHGKTWNYADLEKHRAGEHLDRYLTHDEMTTRFAACHKAIDALATIFNEVKPDILVIIGNDHKESFPHIIPAFSVHWGKTIENAPVPPRTLYSDVEPKVYPGHPELGLQIIKALRADKFDITSLTETPARDDGRKIIPHAFAFIYHCLLKDQVPPSVPIIQNTFYPPNQPPMQRCIEMGRSLARAIESWDSDQSVAVIASGGLSHFIADEEVDRFIIDSLMANNVDDLTRLDEEIYQSGTSETKNWAAMAAGMIDLKFKMNLIDYVPCYRSPAGNGQGMTFASWQP